MKEGRPEEADFILDNERAADELDPSGMLGLVARLGDQFAEALAAPFSLELPRSRDVRVLVIAGMGGSGVAGEILESYLADRLRKPLLVHRDFGLPGLAGPGAFLAVVSYSGNTAEALSAYREGRRRGLPLVVLTSGGKLGEWARADGVSLMELPPGYPPRAAVAFSFVPLLRAARALGAMESGADAEEVKEVPEVLREAADLYGMAFPRGENRPKALALALYRRWPLIHWAEPYLAGVATRFCTQLAENAKVLAMRSPYPENVHNEVVGWDGPDVFTGRLTLVELSGGEERPELQRRRRLVAELARKRGALVEEASAKGRGRLARIFSLVSLADFTSVYLAFLNRCDPTSIAPIEWLKSQGPEETSRQGACREVD